MHDLRSRPVDTRPSIGTPEGFPPPPEPCEVLLASAPSCRGGRARRACPALASSRSIVPTMARKVRRSIERTWPRGRRLLWPRCWSTFPGIGTRTHSQVELQQALQHEPTSEVGMSLHSVVNEQGTRGGVPATARVRSGSDPGRSRRRGGPLDVRRSADIPNPGRWSAGVPVREPRSAPESVHVRMALARDVGCCRLRR